jgi:P-type conjugative transfer protein TrbJ
LKLFFRNEISGNGSLVLFCLILPFLLVYYITNKMQINAFIGKKIKGGLMMKKTRLLKALGITLISASLFTVSAPTLVYADMPVIDGAVLSQLQGNYADQIKNTLQTYQQLQNQLVQLENDSKNLTSLDPSSQAAVTSQIVNTINQMAQVHAQIQAIGTDYSLLQQQWDAMYKDFGDFNGMTGADYAQYQQKIASATEAKIKQAMASQGLASDANIQADLNTLNTLLNNSQGSQGALSAIQASNQIAALQIQQLLKMQRIMADSMGAQATYYQHLEASQKASKERAETFLNMEKKDIDYQSGSVDQFPENK